MIEFDWSKLTTIDSNPVTPDTNGYNLETGGFICNQTNQKNGYKRLRIDGTVTTLKKPVTKLVTDNRSNTADVTNVTGVTSIKDKEGLYAFEERAAISEFDARLSREDAEPKAFAMISQTDVQKKTQQNLFDK